MDRLPCFHGPSDLSGQESLRSQKSNAPSQRDQVVQRSSHRRRMAPIGQESSDNADPSREQEREEMEDAHMGGEPRSSRPSLTYEDENEANARAERRGVDLRHEVFQKHMRGTSNNDRVQAQDKLGRWNDKNIAGQSHDVKIAYNNNNHIVGIVGSTIVEDYVPSQSGMVSFPMTMTSNCKDTAALGLNATCNVNPSTAENAIYPDHVPRFDAIVVPNTETSSKC